MERGLSVEPASPRGIPSDQDCGSFSNLSLPAVVNRYTVNADATLGKGELFFDLTTAGADDAIDAPKWTKAEMFMSAGRAACGFFHTARSIRTIWPGATRTNATLSRRADRHLPHSTQQPRCVSIREKVVRKPPLLPTTLYEHTYRIHSNGLQS